MPIIHREGSHGSGQFPLGVYRNRSSVDGCLLYPHWHEDVEFIRLEEGQARLVVDGEHRIFTQGSIACIPPGRIHGAWIHDAPLAAFSALVFSPALLDNPFLASAMEPFQEFLLKGSCGIWEGQSGDPSSVSWWYSQVLDAHEKHPLLGELRVMSALYGLADAAITHGLSRNPNRLGGTGSRDTQILKTVLMHMQKEYFRPLDVEELAGIAGMGKNGFMRFFKKMTGITSMDYLMEYRLDKAAFMIAGTDRLIKEIAGDTGFANPSHLIKRFHIRYGQTPDQFRKHKNDM